MGEGHNTICAVERLRIDALCGKRKHLNSTQSPLTAQSKQTDISQRRYTSIRVIEREVKYNIPCNLF